VKKAARQWMEFAKRDFTAAKELLNNGYLANIVLFHSQQCIEKCLKAILEEHGFDIPKIHGVLKLHSLIKDNFKIELSGDIELNKIDDIYIDSRSPNSIGLLPAGFPTTENANEIFLIAKKILTATTNFFKSGDCNV